MREARHAAGSDYGTLDLSGDDCDILGDRFTPTLCLSGLDGEAAIFSEPGALRVATLGIGRHTGIHFTIHVGSGAGVYAYRCDGRDGPDRKLLIDPDLCRITIDGVVLAPAPAVEGNRAGHRLRLSGRLRQPVPGLSESIIDVNNMRV